jgi:hypothetical protein
MKNVKEFKKYATIWLCSWAIGLVLYGIASSIKEEKEVAGVIMLLATIGLVTAIGISFYSMVVGLLQFRKAYNAQQAGEDMQPYLDKIHYTLPFALPLGFMGFSPMGFVILAIIFYVIYKWARHIYSWDDMKCVLLHQNGASWGRTIRTWMSSIFFLFAALLPIIILLIIIGILYLLGKSGMINGLFNMAQNTMAGSGTSGFNSCSDCAYYSVGGDGQCWHGHSNSSGRCPYFKQG